jgi:predicted O-methyltransferase YrrM
MLTLDKVLAQPGRFDVRQVYRPGDRCVEALGWDRLEAIYQVKYQVARAVQPATILEVGVRAGYSAAAFLAASPAGWFVGLDSDDGSHGGVRGYLADAATMLLGRYPEAWVELYPWNSHDAAVVRRLQARCRGVFDLIHIDGDHSEHGCASNLTLAVTLARPGGYILIDDYDLLAEVRRAADHFVQAAGFESLHLPSPHGDLLVRVRS